MKIGYLGGIEVELTEQDHKDLLNRFNPDFQDQVELHGELIYIDKACLCVTYGHDCHACPLGKATEDMDFDDENDHDDEGCQPMSAAYLCKKYMGLSYSNISIKKCNLEKAINVMRNIHNDLLKFEEME